MKLLAFISFEKFVYLFQHCKWPAQETGTVPVVSAHFRSMIELMLCCTKQDTRGDHPPVKVSLRKPVFWPNACTHCTQRTRDVCVKFNANILLAMRSLR